MNWDDLAGWIWIRFFTIFFTSSVEYSEKAEGELLRVAVDGSWRRFLFVIFSLMCLSGKMQWCVFNCVKRTLGHVGPGMFLVKQGCCFSSVAAFWVRAGSFQEGQVEVSPKSFIAEQVCDSVGFLGPGRAGILEWSLMQGMGSAREPGVTVPSSLFWNTHGTGEWQVFLPWGVWAEASACGLAAWRCTWTWRAVWGCWGGNAVCQIPVPQDAWAVQMWAVMDQLWGVLSTAEYQNLPVWVFSAHL